MYKNTFDRLITDMAAQTLQNVCKPANLAKVGDVIFLNQKYAYVFRVTHWHPEDVGRPKSPIHEVLVAVQVETDNGDRWWGYSLSDHD